MLKQLEDLASLSQKNFTTEIATTEARDAPLAPNFWGAGPPRLCGGYLCGENFFRFLKHVRYTLSDSRDFGIIKSK
jgi:hypothetical protein